MACTLAVIRGFGPIAVIRLLHECRNPTAWHVPSPRFGGEVNEPRCELAPADSASAVVVMCICVYVRRIPPYGRLVFLVVSAYDVSLRTRCLRL